MVAQFSTGILAHFSISIYIIICSLQSFFILIIGHVKHYLFMYKNYIGKIVKLGFYCLVLFLR